MLLALVIDGNLLYWRDRIRNTNSLVMRLHADLTCLLEAIFSLNFGNDLAFNFVARLQLHIKTPRLARE